MGQVFVVTSVLYNDVQETTVRGVFSELEFAEEHVNFLRDKLGEDWSWMDITRWRIDHTVSSVGVKHYSRVPLQPLSKKDPYRDFKFTKMAEPEAGKLELSKDAEEFLANPGGGTLHIIRGEGIDLGRGPSRGEAHIRCGTCENDIGEIVWDGEPRNYACEKGEGHTNVWLSGKEGTVTLVEAPA